MNAFDSDKIAHRGEPGYVWRSGQDRRLKMVRRWSNLSGRILDNGCGLGTWLKVFSDYTDQGYGLEIEHDRAIKAINYGQGVVEAIGEHLPFADNVFDLVFSNEVIEHVEDDRQAVVEMVRVTKPGGKVIIFCPNRWYPVEQHGIYWRGSYRFGNFPLVNYLPNPLRDRLAPHVRTYTGNALKNLYRGLRVKLLYHGRIFGGYDNIEARWPRFGHHLKRYLYCVEDTPLAILGISHMLVLEKANYSSKECNNREGL